MEELEKLVNLFFNELDVVISPKKVKKQRVKTEMNLMIILDEDVVRNYLQGYSTEEISIKTNIDFQTVDKIIDTYNYLNN